MAGTVDTKKKMASGAAYMQDDGQSSLEQMIPRHAQRLSESTQGEAWNASWANGNRCAWDADRHTMGHSQHCGSAPYLSVQIPEQLQVYAELLGLLDWNG